MRKALFLDRDGVINHEIGYLSKPEDVQFIDGIFETCRAFHEEGYLIVIVTNQSGIARGYYTETEFEDLTRWMHDEFASRGVMIAKTYHCPHHPAITGDCLCRKPLPGMLLSAATELNIDLSQSVLVGDKVSDVEAGLTAGIPHLFLVTTGHAFTKPVPHGVIVLESIRNLSPLMI